MKISKTRLKQIIKEEIERASEALNKPVVSPQDQEKAAKAILSKLTTDQINTLQIYFTGMAGKKTNEQ